MRTDLLIEKKFVGNEDQMKLKCLKKTKNTDDIKIVVFYCPNVTNSSQKLQKICLNALFPIIISGFPNMCVSLMQQQGTSTQARQAKGV